MCSVFHLLLTTFQMVSTIVPLPVVTTSRCLVPHHQRSSLSTGPIYNRNHDSTICFCLLWKQTRKGRQTEQTQTQTQPKTRRVSHLTPHRKTQTNLTRLSRSPAQHRVSLSVTACMFLCITMRFSASPISTLGYTPFVFISLFTNADRLYLSTPLHQMQMHYLISNLKYQPNDNPQPISISNRPIYLV